MQNKVVQQKVKKPQVKRYLLIALIFVVVFVIPIAVACYIYFSQPVSKYRAEYTGFTIDSPVSFYHLSLKNDVGKHLPTNQWHNRWILFYILPASCTDQCHGMLENLYQVVSNSIIDEKHPVDVIVSSFSSHQSKKLQQLLSENYPHFIHVYLQMRDFKRVFSTVKSRRRAMFAGMLYIANPNGKVELSYQNEASLSDINHGLEKLLSTG